MYKFLNSGEVIDPLDVLKEIKDLISYGEELNHNSLDSVIEKIEIQRLSDV